MEGRIYKITNKVNNKVYIGQTVMPLEFRWRQHCVKKDNCHFHNAISKYGKDNFIVEELEVCPISKLSEREIYYISEYNSFKNGYNSTIGGEGKRLELYLDDNILENIVYLYTVEKHSCYKISKEYKVDKASIKKLLKSCGIEVREPKRFTPDDIDTTEIIESFKKGCSLKKLGPLFGVAPTTMKEFLISKGFQFKDKINILEDIDLCASIIKEWTETNITLQKLLRKFHISYNTFKKILAINNIEFKKRHYKIDSNESINIINMYNSGIGIKEISKKYLVDYATIKSILVRNNILKTV